MNKLETTISPERQHIVRTAIFRLSNPLLHEECIRQRRALPFDAEPVFAAKSLAVIPNDEGWTGLAQMLFQLLPVDKQSEFDPNRMYVVEQSPIPLLTDDMESGEVRYVLPDEHAAAHHIQYPDKGYVVL